MLSLSKIVGKDILFSAIDGSAVPVSRVRNEDLSAMLSWAKREVCSHNDGDYGDHDYGDDDDKEVDDNDDDDVNNDMIMM